MDADGEMAKTIIIFHCEFSKKRGPETAKELRKADRATNTRSYPALHYPEVYILEGGYCEFFKKQPVSALCPRHCILLLLLTPISGLVLPSSLRPHG